MNKLEHLNHHHHLPVFFRIAGIRVTHLRLDAIILVDAYNPKRCHFSAAGRTELRQRRLSCLAIWRAISQKG